MAKEDTLNWSRLSGWSGPGAPATAAHEISSTPRFCHPDADPEKVRDGEALLLVSDGPSRWKTAYDDRGDAPQVSRIVASYSSKQSIDQAYTTRQIIRITCSCSPGILPSTETGMVEAVVDRKAENAVKGEPYRGLSFAGV